MKDIFTLSGSTYKVVDGDFTSRGFHTRAVVFIARCLALKKMKTINGKKITSDTIATAAGLMENGNVAMSTPAFREFVTHIKATYPMSSQGKTSSGCMTPFHSLN